MKIEPHIRVDWNTKVQELVHEAIDNEVFKASQKFTESLEYFFTKEEILFIYRKAIYTDRCFTKAENRYYEKEIKKKLKALLILSRFKNILETMTD